MPVQKSTNAVIAGFGARLRDERKRLGLSQAQLAQAGGVLRLAQGQYESEQRLPRVDYLCSINAAGIDLGFVLWGRRLSGLLPSAEMRKVEQRAFELVDEYVKASGSQPMGAESRFLLFDLIRSQLVNAVSAGLRLEEVAALPRDAHG